MGGLDVITIGNFYQAPQIRDSWISKFKTNKLNILGTNL
jgi:hypothetical protein